MLNCLKKPARFASDPLRGAKNGKRTGKKLSTAHKSAGAIKSKSKLIDLG